MIYWNPWFEAVKFSFEVQSVIAMRLLKIAAGGAGSSAECTRMVTEKIKAAADAHTAGAIALAKGKSIRTATKRAMAPVSNCHVAAGRSLIDLAASRLALRAPRFARLWP